MIVRAKVTVTGLVIFRAQMKSNTTALPLSLHLWRKVTQHRAADSIEMNFYNPPAN